MAFKNRKALAENFAREVEEGDIVKISFEPDEATRKKCPDIEGFDFVGFVDPRLDYPGFYYLGISNKKYDHLVRRWDGSRSGTILDLGKIVYIVDRKYYEPLGAIKPERVYEMIDFKILGRTNEDPNRHD